MKASKGSELGKYIRETNNEYKIRTQRKNTTYEVKVISEIQSMTSDQKAPLNNQVEQQPNHWNAHTKTAIKDKQQPNPTRKTN